MLAHPEYCFCIACVPRRALIHSEEAPWVLVVLVGHEDTNSLVIRLLVAAYVLLPHNAQKQWASVVHDRYVGHLPVSVEPLKIVDYIKEERVIRYAAHGIVRYASGDCLTQPRRVGEQRVQAPVAALF